MQVELLGSTDVDVDTFAVAAFDHSQISLNRGADLYQLPMNEKLKFLTQIGTFAGNCDNVSIFLRECERELTFLSYIFLIGLDEQEIQDVLKFLRFSELNFVALPHRGDLAVMVGNLRQLTQACLEGTNSPHNCVVELFDRIFLILTEREGLSAIMKRYHRDPIQGSQLFRLRRIS